MRHLPAFYFDLALGMVFALIAIIAVSTVQPPKKADTPLATPKAEYLVILSWNDLSPNDLDLYLKSPNGNIIYFKNKNAPEAFLDLDNTGRNNTVQMPDGSSKEIPTRQEVITIRTIIPGEWVCNVHEYYKNSGPSYIDRAKVTVIRLNPYQVIIEASMDFDAAGEEKTMANFVLAPDGHVSDLFVAPVKMVGATP